MSPRPLWQHVFRLRTLVYTAMWSMIGVALIYGLFVRSDIGLSVEPVRNPQFVTLSDGAIRNTYTLRIRNLTADDREFRILLDSDDILRIDVGTKGPKVNHVIVPANETLNARVFVTARPTDPAATNETTDLSIWVEDVNDNGRAGKATVFNGKG